MAGTVSLAMTAAAVVLGVMFSAMGAMAQAEVLTAETVGRYLDTMDEIGAWRASLPREQAGREEEMPEEREIMARHGFDHDSFGAVGTRVLTAFAGLALVPNFREVIEQRARRAETSADLTPDQRQQVAGAARQMIGPAEAMAAGRDRDRAAIEPYLDRLERLYNQAR